MGELLNKAITTATKAHNGQKRKGNDIPYILHPMEAAAIVATMTNDEEVIAAAMLHDVVEDTYLDLNTVKILFGDRVASLVAYETENKRTDLPPEETWKIRKQETLDHLKTAPIEVKMITLGDKLSNIRAMYRDYKVLGDELWSRFNMKYKDAHYWYYQSISFCLTELKEYPAFEEYCTLVRRTFMGVF